MKIEIVSIGTELLVSDIIDTNSAYISRCLREVDISLTSKVTVGDDLDMIVDVLTVAMRRADAVLTTGGLGDGKQDFTRQALAKITGGSPIQMDESQETCVIIGEDKQYGRGILFELPEGVLISLPGNRRELAYLLEADVLPYLQNQAKMIAKESKWSFIRTVGIMESSLKQELADISVGQNHRLTFHSFAGQTDIRIWVEHASVELLENELQRIRQIIFDRLGDHIFGSEEDLLERVVFELLKTSNYRLAIGECYTNQVIVNAFDNVASHSDILEFTAVNDWNGLAEALNLEPLDPDNLTHWCREAALAQLALKKTDLSLIVFNNVTQGGVQLLVTLASQYGVSVTQRSFGGHPDHIHHWALTLSLTHLRRWLIVHQKAVPDISPNL
ncbi:MAG: molybdopterin-binding protein [Chloroflexota bacterium]